MQYVSSISEADWKYPFTPAHGSGFLAISGTSHRIYWEEYGNPGGEPVVFLHGGPGGGCSPAYSRFFDPARYRILLFDQRGCGKSTPNASDDPTGALTDNTTGHLIEDILALRDARNIRGKMHLFGGSWGSTLALAYAIHHPQTVQSLILRGIFLCRKQDLDYFYQGNAAYMDNDPANTTLPGAYMAYPEAWAQYVAAIPPAERGDMIKAYAKRFAAGGDVTALAKAWSIWEGTTSYLALESEDLNRFADAQFARAFARIENHYFMNGAFLGGSGEANRKQNFILEHIARIAHIPCYIVHGRYDQVCPLFQAETLVTALRSANAAFVDYRITPAGHSMMERENNRALTDIMDQLPRMNNVA